jgi:phosphoribosyl 1,2-cyclic phosphate phosphodiesterase
MERELDLYAEERVAAQLREMFGYAFRSDINVNSSFVPQLLLRKVEPGVRLELLGAGWTPVRLLHGRLPILGFRVDRAGASLAYCTDVSAIPPESYPLLEGLDVLVLDALRYRHHPTHLTVDQALDVIDRLAPARSYLTHVSHEIDHGVLQAALPQGVFVAYDGLRVVVPQRSPATRG